MILLITTQSASVSIPQKSKTPVIGVYKITSPSGRNYRYGKCKGQASLYESFQKYGVKNHSFEIIKEIQEKATKELTQLELDESEIFFIKQYDTRNKKYGMNLKSGGSHGKHSEETKLKLSIAHKGIRLGFKQSEETKSRIGIGNKGKTVSEEAKHKMRFGKENPLSKKVVQLSLSGEEIKVWDGMSDVQRELAINRSKISAVCKGKLKTTGGFKWKYFIPEII